MQEKPTRKQGKLFVIIYLSVLFLFTAYLLLDSFVIERRFAVVSDEEDQEKQQDNETVITDNRYKSSDVEINLSHVQIRNTIVHIADIRLSNAEQLKTAFAQDTYGRNVTERVAEIAKNHEAILAINGDYYGARKFGYVIRNGILYRETSQGKNQEDLCIWPDGTMSIILESEISAQELQAQGAWQVFSFGPGLLKDGQLIVDENDEVGQAMISNPRTAIAMIEPLHYLFVVADGRTSESEGLSLYELAEALQDCGAQLAYNLDGGGSSTFVFLDQVLNYPTTNGKYKERAVSDIVYIGE